LSALAAFLVGLSLVLDVSGQLLFKAGLNRAGEGIADAGGRAFWLALARSPLLLLGLLAYAVEIPCWAAVLAILPLSIAFPLASLSYCGVAIGARFLLGEKVPARRWLATLLIALGVAIAAGMAPAGEIRQIGEVIGAGS
jgi:drug/metabolite transporter (DMT)-like permease